jgi:hypothetical protein
MRFVTIHVEKAVFEVVDPRDVFDLEAEVDARDGWPQAVHGPKLCRPKGDEDFAAMLQLVEISPDSHQRWHARAPMPEQRGWGHASNLLMPNEE